MQIAKALLPGPLGFKACVSKVVGGWPEKELRQTLPKLFDLTSTLSSTKQLLFRAAFQVETSSLRPSACAWQGLLSLLWKSEETQHRGIIYLLFFLNSSRFLDHQHTNCIFEHVVNIFYQILISYISKVLRASSP